MSHLDETYRFTVTEDEMVEAMVLAGGSAHGRLWRKGVAALVSALYFALMLFGGIGLAFVGFYLLTGDILRGMLPLTIAGAAGLGFGAFWYNSLLRFMAADIVAKPFNIGEHEMRITEDGVTLRARHAQWDTAWPAVHDVKLGRQVLAFCISGIALCVPISAIGSPDDAKALLDRINAVRKGAA